jgi:dTDP-D-glucose 4,6-dehydratase
MSRYEIGPGRDGQPVLYDEKSYQIAEVYDEDKVKHLLSRLDKAEEALRHIVDATGNDSRYAIMTAENAIKEINKD